MKIGLIALSGVRACDAELMKTGLTLPGFIERSQVIASLPSLGLLTLAGMTPERHECCYLEVADVRRLPALPKCLDMVAISSFSAQIDQAYQLADQFRKAGVVVVMGGLHVSMLPDEALAHCDSVVVGEGETSWVDLLGDLERRKLRRRYGPNRQFDLTRSPMPAFELLEIDKYNRLTVQTSRGCPLRCEFCAASPLIAPAYRQKPIGTVLAEIDHICDLWRRPFIEFADDNAFVNKSYWMQLLPELACRKIRWFAETDLSVASDVELLRMMRRSGCAELLIGLESPSQPGLRGIELRSDRKRRWQPTYVDAVKRIQSQGIRVNGCFVLGLDGQGTEAFDEIYRFAIESELYDVQITIQTPFPGTPLHERLHREGRLLYPGQWDRCTLFDVNFSPLRMTVDELRQGFRELAGRLYSKSLTEWRRENFNRKYLRNSQANQEALA